MSEENPPQQDQQAPNVSDKPQGDLLITPRETHFHNVFVKYLIMLISALGSVIYTTVLCTGSILNHWFDIVTGREKTVLADIEQRSHGYVPREPYDELSKMKPTSDLQYYLQQLDLDLQEYRVTTCDGYILTLHRIIDPRELEEQRQQRKPVLLQHGLLSCSGTWIVSGKNSLGYYFHEQGYDVWMGNNRSWFIPQHKTLSGSLYNNEQYWDWGVQELACHDLPALISTVLANKKYFQKLVLLGHLQGGLQSFLMLKNPRLGEIHEKVELFCPLAPAVYPGKLFYTRQFIKFINNRSEFMWLILFGCCAFLRNLCLVRHYIASSWVFGKLSYYMFKYLFGWTGRNWGPYKKVWHFCFIFNMSYASVELMKYYLSKHSDCGFTTLLQPKAAYSSDAHFTENVTDDKKSYFQFDTTWFSGIKVPMIVFIGDEDFLVDGEKVVAHMRKYEPGYREGSNFEAVSIPTYNHLDIVWAEDVIGTIGYTICNKLKQMKACDVQEGLTLESKEQAVTIPEGSSGHHQQQEEVVLNEKIVLVPEDIHDTELTTKVKHNLSADIPLTETRKLTTTEVF